MASAETLAQIRGMDPEKYDWPAAREWFVITDPRPSYAEVAKRWLIPVGSISRVAGDEGWAGLRSEREDTLLAQCDAKSVIRKAVASSSAIVGAAEELAKQLFGALISNIAKLESEEMKCRARSDILNTTSFAFTNTANACKSMGILGWHSSTKLAAGELPGAPQNGHWDSKLVQQINVTVQAMQAAEAKGKPAKDELATKIAEPEITETQ